MVTKRGHLLSFDDRKQVSRLTLLSEAERRKILVEWNATEADYPKDECIHELFEAQAARTPDAAAVVHKDRHLTYAELNAKANRLAHYLRGLGVKPDARVAICVERSLDMVVGLLAILKAGGAYVPLDPAYPAERLAFMLKDSQPLALLTAGEAKAALPDRLESLAIIDLDADARLWGHAEDSNLGCAAIGLRPDHLAYVIYTSGSTGAPKGVMVEHGGVVNLLWSMQKVLAFNADDRFVSQTTIGFDIAALELYLPLISGARTILVDQKTGLDPALLGQTLIKHEATFLQATPSTWGMLIEAGCAGLENIKAVSGGEALTAELAKRLIQRTRKVWNLYGPTETTIWSSALSGDDLSKVHARVPIGRPIANTQIYILDANLQPAPIGVTGEIYIGGAGVARGYLNRPELTAERFLLDPFAKEPNARMYRTGDLGRWRADGAIEYLGRNDFQVKIRGFRIELGEIEARLREHPGVREATVVAREDSPGDKRLVAYYTGEEGLDARALRAHLTAALPDYMAPAIYVRLDALPLNANGKLDCKALPAPERQAFGAREYEALAGTMEETLAGIWASLLKVDRVGRHDNFFELGGHSLLAVQVVSRIRQVLGLEVRLADVFARPVLADFAALLGEAAGTTLAPIPAADRTKTLPLSFAQQRLWFLAQLEGASEAYHVPLNLKLAGRLDREALRRGLDGIVHRHEALRTTFAEVDGEPVQRIAAAETGFALTEHDLRGRPDIDGELQRLAEEEATAPFDLACGPLIRGRLVQEGADAHTLLITVHHIVCDGWSMAVFMDEFKTLYGAFLKGDADPLPPLPIQYVDYAAWERTALQDNETVQQQAAYWKKTLAGTPALLELPADRPRPAQQDYAGAMAAVELDAELTRRLRDLSQRHGVTLYVTFLAAWAALMARLSGQEDVVIGSPAANRGRAEFEPLIGFFVNTLPMRIDLSGDPTVSELLARVKEQALAAQQHQDLPFEQVVEAVKPQRSLAYAPLFQVMFAWQNAPSASFELPGLQVASIAAPHETARLDLVLYLDDTDGVIRGGLEYATSLFERETIERYLGYWKHLVAAMAADAGKQVGRLPLLSETERHQVVVEWNATVADYPRDRCVHELFEAQAAETPYAIAIVHEDHQLTYAELNAQANRLARYLRSLGVNPGDYLPIFLERSINLVVAELAVLKAGAAYVPIDPAFPSERQAFMVRDCGARIVIAADGVALPEGLDAARVDVDKRILTEGAAGNLAMLSDSEATAYVMYTSGSTGQPKGVVIPHRGITRLVLNSGYVKLDVSDTVAFAANPAFDATTFEVWAPLLHGGRIAVIGQEALLEPLRFGQSLKRHSVSVLWLTVGLFNQYADALAEEFSHLRYLLTGGDALDPRVIDRVLRNCPPQHLINGYGPTETTTFATTYEITGVPEGATSIPLGRPIANTQIYILDANLQPTPIGVTGEIYIGGAGVARGYLNQPELTAERFLRDPFAKEPNGRMYKTGDLGRWRADGAIEYLGRNDFQVKIRGFRIELGEIEARLREHPGVREAMVVAREDSPGDKQLVAYYTGGADLEAKDLRAHVGAALPGYMVPVAYVKLDALPLNANGKLDRKTLPAPEGEAFGSRDYEAPVTTMEQILAEIWAEVLKVERMGRRDNFFDLGGHSLTAVRLLARIEEEIGRRYSLSLLFKAPTIEHFSKEMGKIHESESISPNVVIVQAKGSKPPIFAINTPSMYYRLSRHLGDRQPLIGLQLFDILREKELAKHSFGDIAAEYVELIRQTQPRGPYAIMGWCVGGALAFEAARQLSEAGEDISFVGIVSGWVPGYLKRLGVLKAGLVKYSERWHNIRSAAHRETIAQFAKRFMMHVRRKLAEPQPEASSIGQAQNPQLLAENLRRLAERYEFKPFCGKVTVFSPSLEPKGFFLDSTLGWREFCRKGVDVIEISGDHNSVFKDPGAGQIAAHIASVLHGR